MFAYLGLVAYLISSIFRPGDWVEFLIDSSTDYWSFILAVGGGFLAGKFGRLKEVAKTTQSKMILLYIFFCVLSIISVGATYILTDRFMILIKLFAVFLIFGAFADSIRRIQGLLLTIIILVAMVAYQGHLLKTTGQGWAGQGLYWGERIRWVGMYDGANVLCMIFVIAMAFIIHFVFGPWGIKTKIISLGASWFIINGIYLTNSRGGFLAFVVVVGLFFLLRGAEKMVNISFFRLIAIGGALSLLLMVGPSRMASMNDDDNSAAGRIDAWQEGLEMVRAHPFLGVGEGQWREHHFRLAHNALVQTMGEVGMLGLFAWLAMLYLCAKSFFLTILRSDDPQMRSLASACLAAFGGFMSTSFFITTTQFDLTYIFAGLATSMVMMRKSEVTLTRAEYIRLGAMSFAGVLLIWVTVRVFYGG